MAYLRRWVAALAISLGLVGTATVARAEGGAVLAIDEPRSGLHIEVEGACLARIRDADAGTPTCPELAIRGDSEAFAVVTGEGGGKGPRYSVDVVVEDQLGTGEERARRVAQVLDEALLGAPTVVTLAEQRFLRVRFRLAEGRGVGFITVDDRPELATVLFVGLDAETAEEVEQRADVAMATVRRAPRRSGLPPGAAGVPNKGSDALVIAFLVIVVGAFGLFVFLKFVFIARLFGFKLGSLGGDAGPMSEPRRPRDPKQDGPQVAGMQCAACKRNILSDFDGMTCADCEAPIHKKCHGKHVAGAHGPTPGAYR